MKVIAGFCVLNTVASHLANSTYLTSLSSQGS
jgi:hypothetical protein